MKNPVTFQLNLKDERVPFLTFHYKGGYTIAIYDENKSREIGGFTLPAKNLSPDELGQEVYDFVTEQYFP